MWLVRCLLPLARASAPRAAALAVSGLPHRKPLDPAATWKPATRRTPVASASEPVKPWCRVDLDQGGQQYGNAAYGGQSLVEGPGEKGPLVHVHGLLCLAGQGRWRRPRSLVQLDPLVPLVSLVSLFALFMLRAEKTARELRGPSVVQTVCNPGSAASDPVELGEVADDNEPVNQWKMAS